jgi:glycosyltransferase involved in cell wall biosynthesis
LLQNEEQRRQFGLRGRKLVETSYSLKGFVESYVKLFREVTAAPDRLDPSEDLPPQIK